MSHPDTGPARTTEFDPYAANRAANGYAFAADRAKGTLNKMLAEVGILKNAYAGEQATAFDTAIANVETLLRDHLKLLDQLSLKVEVSTSTYQGADANATEAIKKAAGAVLAAMGGRTP
jgi:uncharacterized protein YukE